MSGTLAAILLLTVALAAANGSNDDAKGVATLAGAGVTRYGIALAWGVIATLSGALLSLAVAGRISTLFSTGIVAAPSRPGFGLAVLAGSAVWVALATWRRLPVSTTHAIVGALLGAGLLLAPGAIAWSALLFKVVLPLLGSVGFSYVLAALLMRVGRHTPQCVCVDIATREIEARAGLVLPGGASPAIAVSGTAPSITIRTSADSSCPVHQPGVARVRVTMNAAHWLTSGATSFARGLNDTPKIVVLGSVALVPGVLQQSTLLVLVSVSMALGGAVAGIRVARRLGDEVVRMDHHEGFMANLTTALLVGVGANVGLPMSTTHVSAGAIAGVAAGAAPGRLRRDTLRDFVLAWTLTPLVSGTVALVVFAVSR